MAFKDRVQLFFQDHRKHAWLLFVLSVGVVSALVMQLLVTSALPTYADVEEGIDEMVVGESPNSPLDLRHFQGLAILGQSALVADLTTGQILFAKNEYQPLPLASITKLMTALIVLEAASPDSIVTLTKNDLKEGGGGAGLREGEKWKMGTLLDIVLLMSSNDGALALSRFVGEVNGVENSPELAREYFVSLMNARALDLKLESMKFFNESGLDFEQEMRPGGIGSARDAAVLMATLWKKFPSFLEITRQKDARLFSEDGLAHILINTNTGLYDYPGMLASKTGYTVLAGGNLAIIFDVGIGRPIVAVVLGSTLDGRFSDMKMIVDATVKAFSK